MLSEPAWNTSYSWGFELTYYLPHVMAVVFIVFLSLIDEPLKLHQFLRAALALSIATVLSHLDRWFDLWPGHPYFASGHMTFVAGVAASLGFLRSWTALLTLPLLVPYGIALNKLGFHCPLDIFGAIPIVLIVYILIYKYWTIKPPSAAPLDMAPESP